jgi:hypothetical protein
VNLLSEKSNWACKYHTPSCVPGLQVNTDQIRERNNLMINRKNKAEWEMEVPATRPWRPYRDYGEEQHRRTGIHTGKGPRSYRPSDERIYEEICERMTRHGQLDASNITVEVENGEVTLTGSVSGRWAKRLAEDISDSVYGVSDVHNLLELQGKDEPPKRWVDEVGRSGVYPASEAGNAPKDAEAQGLKTWGQGERGARGYDDHGGSELHLDREE